MNQPSTAVPSPSARASAVLGSFVMSWMFLFGMIGTGLVGPNRSSIEREFGLSHTQFGAAFALVQIVCSLGVLYAASRVRRFDSVTALMVSLLVQTLGFVGVYLSRGTMGLTVGWTLITLGTVLGSVANNVSASLWPQNPRRGVTLLHGFNGVGKVAGPLVAAVCLALGWRQSFLAVGAITFALLLAFRACRARFAGIVAPSDNAAAPSSSGGGFRSAFYWLCVLPFGLIAGGDVAFAALVPLYYETSRGLSAQAASLLLTAHLLGLAVGRFAFVYLSERLSNNAVIGLCLLAGLFVFPAVLADSIWVWAVSLFGVGWMFSSTWPTYYAQITRFFPPHTRHLLDYGSALGNAVGIALCMYASSALADRHLALALGFGPFALWLFGLLYFFTPLSRAASEEGRTLAEETS